MRFPPMTLQPAWRLSFYFGALFAVVGVVMPYWPVYLGDRGLSAVEIGLILSLGLWIKVLVNPLIAQWADRHGARRPVMLALCAIVIAAYAVVGLTDGVAMLAVFAVVASVAFAAIMPLGETTALTVVYDRGLDYGRLRLWGSLTFIAASMGLGSLLATEGADVVLWAILAIMATTLVACWLMPRVAVPKAEAGPAPLIRLLRQPVFVLFLAAASLSQASHAVLYAFGTLHWRANGIDDWMIGWLWAEGVIAEVVLFAFGAWLVNRVGVVGLLALGAAAGALRWFAYGFSSDLSLLLAMQVLHAFTFGATHLGAMHFIARAAPPAWAASAQSLYTAVSGGIAMGLAMWASGLLYDRYAGAAFFAMAAISAAGLVTALVLRRRWDGETLRA